MIDTHGNVRPGKPRKGREVVEYQRVKAQIVELLDVEVPDREIAATLGLSRSGFYQLKKRILKEVIVPEIALNVAAREFMRLDRQMKNLIKYLDASWAGDSAPDATYISAFTNMSRRIADLVGANAAIAITVDHGGDDEATERLHAHQLDMAKQLNRFYELTDRIRGADGIGSGLTKEERDRELANLRSALPSGEQGEALGEILEEDADHPDNDDPDIEDAIELIEDDGFEPDEWDRGELVEIPRDTGRKCERLTQYAREIATGTADNETPGRWVAGKFVSWWHDLGDPDPSDGFDYDMKPLGNELDGPPDD